MHRLVVNPNTPQAWEIQLKPGENFLGRGFANDFKFDDPSVSSSHCRILIGEGAVVIKDLGSTNGTFVNRAPVQETSLENGQAIRLGSVEMVFLSEAPPASSSPPPPPRPAAIRVARAEPAPTHAPEDVIVIPSAPPRPPALRVTAAHAAAPPPPPLAPPLAPPMPPPIAELHVGPRFCKFHPKSPARYLCNKCNRTFCELCIISRTVHGEVQKTCRSCGVPVVPLHVERAGPAGEKGFFGQLPGAFIYPFRGSGLLVLIVATLLFSALAIMSAGWMSILMKIVALGYLFSFMQAIIHSTAAEDSTMPELPGMDGVFGAFLSLAGTVLMSFGIAIGLGVARFWFDVEAIPTAAIIAAVIFGCLYFPMAFLATAMKDTALAANPLIVLPGIMKVPLEYIVTVILMSSIFGVQQLGDLIAGGASHVSLTTRSMSVLFISFGVRAIWSFLSVYFLTVNMRILGLLYVTKKDKLAWF
jgi:hypothetical protein